MKNFLIGLLGILILLALGWAVTCCLVALVTLCFGLPFAWGVGTGIYIILLALKFWSGLNINWD